jgi:hypothetical protein
MRTKKMMSRITNLAVDTTAFIDEHGFGVAVYIGEDACEPTFEETFHFETLIENHFESFVVYDRIRQEDREDASLIVTKLEQMAKYARNMLEDYTSKEEHGG